MSYYLCKQNGGNLQPIKGPMRSQEVVNLILAMGDLEAQAPYCNASRYELGKLGLYPRNKAGDTKLIIDLAINNLDEEAQDRRRVAIEKEGYIDEVCPTCKVAMLAHHHFINCELARIQQCPMSNNVSILDMLFK